MTEQEKQFQLDKKELTKEVPLMLRPVVGAAIDWLNHLDANHDGKSDLAQLAPYVMKAMPVCAALAPLIHWDKMLEWFINHDFIKDKEQARKIAEQLLKVALEAAQKVGK